jgi:hypothetical protein
LVKAPEPGDRYLPWAELLRRVHEVDVLSCEKCEGRMKVTAFVTERKRAREILEKLGLPAKTPARAPARDPPRQEELASPGFYPDEPWTDAIESV